MYNGAYKYLHRSNNLETSVGIFLNANKACFKKIRKSFELDKKEPIKVTSRNRREYRTSIDISFSKFCITRNRI